MRKINKKNLIVVPAAITVGAFGLAFATSINAYAGNGEGRGMGQTISAEERETIRTEMQSRAQEKLKELYDNGEISDLDFQIASVMDEIRSSIHEKFGFRGDFPEEYENLTLAEMQALRQQTILDMLAEKGINISIEDLESHRDTMHELMQSGLGNRLGKRFQAQTNTEN